ncbi:hypothetical protein JCM1393_07830 [Clostridium carnis]
MKIALDYGHTLSGADTGASGNGYREEKCTREIGVIVKRELEALGNTVIVVSPDYANSISESLKTRVEKINASGASLSVSIHLNSGGGKGTEIYTKKGIAFKEAVNVLNQIVALGYLDRGIKDGSDLALVGGVNMQAMLIECFFIDTSDMSMYNPENVAIAIVRGLVGDSVITKPNNPTITIPPVNQPTITQSYYLNLSANVSSWRVYSTNEIPVVGNEVGYLNPAQYGGLSYKILANPQSDVFTINTSTFGVVNIYTPPGDPDWTISTAPENVSSIRPNTSKKRYLNLSPNVATWRVYRTNVAPVIGNEVGYLAPAQYGGLSYEILGNPQVNVYTIKTGAFGEVNIYAPRDNDSSITSSPMY